MDLILINQAPLKMDMYVNKLPPLGILSISSYLEKKNIKVDVVDCFIEALERFEIKKYNILGFSLNIANVENSLRTIRKIKSEYSEKMIIIGGPLVSSLPDLFIKQEGVDIVAIGESEETMYEIMTESNLEKIDGIYYKKNKNEIIKNKVRKLTGDLDSFPFPSLEKVDINKYYSPMSKNKPISNINTSRGCPSPCTFCYKTTGKTWRSRSAQNVINEIEWQVKELGVKELCIYDDNFSFDQDRAEEICDGIIDKNIKVDIQFPNGLRADRLNKPLIEKLGAAGTWLLGIAPESGNSDILKNIKKNYSFEHLKKVRDICKKNKIVTYGFYMVGFPGERKYQVEDTINFSIRLDTDLAQFSRVTPLPGTELFNKEYKNKAVIDFTKEHGLFFSEKKNTMVANEKINFEILIRKAYRKFYLRIGKAISLIQVMPIKGLIKLFFYSVKTNNI